MPSPRTRAAGALLLAGLSISEPAPAAGAAGAPGDPHRRLEAALEAGDLVAARALLPRAVALREALDEGDELALADYLDDLGVLFYNAPIAGDAWLVSEELFLRVLEIRTRTLGEHHLEVVDVLETLATLAYELERYAEAEVRERRVLELLPGLLGEDHPRLAERSLGLAFILFQQGRYDEAETALDRAGEILDGQEESDPWVEVERVRFAAELYRVEDRFHDAEEAGREALEIARGLEDEALVAEILTNLQGLYLDEGRYADAEPLGREVLEIWEGDPFYYSNLPTGYLNQAELLRRQGRLEEARPLFTRALELAREQMQPDAVALAIFLDRSAKLEADAGRYREAEELYRESLEVFARTGLENHPSEGQSRHELAGVMVEMGRYEEAGELYRQAVAIRSDAFGPEHPEVALSLIGAAEGHYRRGAGDAPAALAEVDRAIAILDRSTAFPEGRADAHALRARFLRRAGDLDAAIASLATSLELVEQLRPQTGGSERTRAERWASYLGLFDRMVDWQLEAGRPGEALASAERGRARVLLDQLAAARVDIRGQVPPEILAPLEQRERSARSRVAGYQAQIARARGDTLDPERRRAITELEARLDAASRELQLVSNEIRSASPLWRNVITAGGRGASVERIQEQLVPDGGLLLLYQIGGDRSHLFVVPPAPRPLEVRELQLSDETATALGLAPGPLTAEGLREPLALLESELRSPFGVVPGEVRRRGFELELTTAGADVFDRLHALWRLLVPGDIWARLREAEEIVLVPHGRLHALPFEALVTDPEPRSERFWLDDGPVIRYAPSATALLNLERPRPGIEGERPAMLLVSDPVYDPEEVARMAGSGAPAAPEAKRDPTPGGGVLRTRLARSGVLERLPGTAREARQIQAALGRDQRGPIVDLRDLGATEPAVRAALRARPRLLHFATHGLVDESGNELLAGLALTPPATGAGSPEDDGFLQLFEVYEQRLDAELAVLSACSSQVGRRVAGEGVFALSRGFLAAGARRVVASLWPVDDDSTAALMGDFYRRLAAADRAGGTDWARALRDARRSLREQDAWASPFFWAPFVLTGTR